MKIKVYLNFFAGRKSTHAPFQSHCAGLSSVQSTLFNLYYNNIDDN